MGNILLTVKDAATGIPIKDVPVTLYLNYTFFRGPGTVTSSGVTNAAGEISFVNSADFYHRYIELETTPPAGYLPHTAGFHYPNLINDSPQIVIELQAPEGKLHIANIGEIPAPDAIPAGEVSVAGLTEFAKDAPLFGAIGHPTLTEAINTAQIRVVNAVGDPVEFVNFRVEYPGGAAIRGNTNFIGEGKIYQEPTRVLVYKDCHPATIYNFVWPRDYNQTIELVFEIPPCIEDYPINEINFLRWHIATGLILPARLMPVSCNSNCLPPGALTVPVWQPDPENYFLPLVYQDKISFFINSATGVNYTDFEGLKIGLMKCNELVFGNIGTLQRIGAVGGYRIFGEFTTPAAPDGVYNLVIYRESNKNVLLVSNPVRVMNFSDWVKDTFLIRYRNTANVFGFHYRELPEFYNQFRIEGALNDEQTPTDQTTFTDTFENVMYDAKPPVMNRTVQLATYEMNRETHTAINAALVMHQMCLIKENTQPGFVQYKAPEGYERQNEANDQRLKLSMGTAKLLDRNFAKIGVICDTQYNELENPEIPGNTQTPD